MAADIDAMQSLVRESFVPCNPFETHYTFSVPHLAAYTERIRQNAFEDAARVCEQIAEDELQDQPALQRLIHSSQGYHFARAIRLKADERSAAPTGADTEPHGTNDMNSDSPLPHHESADTGPHGSNKPDPESEPEFSAAALRQRIGRESDA